MRVITAPGCATWDSVHCTAMGSPAHVVFGDGAPGLRDWARAELERFEQCWSRFRADAELRRLNRSVGSWFEASDTLLDALCKAAVLFRATDGRFDPTIHDRLVELGYDRTFAEIAPGSDTSGDRVADDLASRPTPSFASVRIEGNGVLLEPGTALDLGGLGKGLAADRVAAGLIARGARAACVGLGGDIRVAGAPPSPTGWPIPVEHPLLPGTLLGVVDLHDGAIVTSTSRIRTWMRGSRRLHHLIDPSTGHPAERGVAAVVCSADRAWFAEGLAKAALIAGPSAGRRLLDQHAVGGWLVLEDGRCIASEWAPPLRSVPA